jgi:hypothetical protein
VQKAKQEEQALRVELQQLQDDARHAGASTRDLQVLEQEVPATADLPGVIRSLNTQSVVSGVDFMTVTPGQPQLSSDGKYSVVPVSLTLSGGYWAIDQFLYRLENLPRVVTVGTISIASTQQQTTGSTSAAAATTGSTSPLGELQVQLTASFFTTDLSAGPGSVPGPTGPDQLPTGIVPGASTTTGTTTSSNPTPTPSASSGSTGGA